MHMTPVGRSNTSRCHHTTRSFFQASCFREQPFTKISLPITSPSCSSNNFIAYFCTVMPHNRFLPHLHFVHVHMLMCITYVDLLLQASNIFPAYSFIQEKTPLAVICKTLALFKSSSFQRGCPTP